MPPSSKEMIKRLTDDGWYRVGQTGSHIHFKHPTKKGRVTIQENRKDIPIGTLKSIIKRAELD